MFIILWEKGEIICEKWDSWFEQPKYFMLIKESLQTTNMFYIPIMYPKCF